MSLTSRHRDSLLLLATVLGNLVADHQEHQGDGESVEDDLGREQDSGVCVTVSVLVIWEGRNREC